MSATCHILGASGTIGSAIADRLTERSPSAVRRWDSAACDLLDAGAVRSAFADGSTDDRYVFCAARTRDRGDHVDDDSANRQMLDNLLRALGGRAAHVVFFSSVDVYGRPPANAVLDERSPLAPDSPYAASKAWCETRLKADDLSCPVTIFRPPGVYGPGDALRSTAGVLSRKILAGEPIELPPRPVHRDYVRAADLAALTEVALGSGIAGTFVVATGQSLPLREIVTLLERGLQRRAVPFERTHPSARDVDLRFDPRRLRAAFGGVPLMPMADGLVHYGEWVRRRGQVDHGVNQK